MCWVWKFRCTLICTVFECVRSAVGLCLCAVYVLYSELHSSVVVISHQHQYECRAVAMDFKNYDMWLVLSELLCRSHIHCHVSVGIIWIQSQIERNGLRLVQSWTNAHISFTHFAKISSSCKSSLFVEIVFFFVRSFVLRRIFHSIKSKNLEVTVVTVFTIISNQIELKQTLWTKWENVN